MARKKTGKTYERKQRIYISHSQSQSQQATGLKFNKNTSAIKLTLPSGEEVEPEVVFTVTEYDRKSGKRKVVTSIPDIVALVEPEALLKHFDAVIAVDTNTWVIKGVSYSVSAFIGNLTKTWVKTPAKDGYTLDVSAQLANYLAFKNCSPKDAEKLAISKVISIVMASDGYDDKLRYAIVTDHDLGNHTKYNSGEIPIFGDFRMPSNFRLLYATADSGKDSVMTAFLCTCDSDANEILRELRDTGVAKLDGGERSLGEIPDYDA